jgi:molybdopterin/thiamine biosynthesis adenylyltransferase/rhodanese-related sulfurtransferase
MEDLTPGDRARYARHLTLPRIGEGGQAQLKSSKVFCVGAGGLGSPALLYLAAAGIGRLTIIDDDTIERSNLQRQILHADQNVGALKAESAMLRLRELNPSISIEIYTERLTSENALELLSGHDIVVDGTDNIPTRYLINDACELLGIPWVYGSIYRFEGQVSVFNMDGGPTYRDLFPTPPSPESVPSCEDGGVLGVLPGVIGSIQATEAIKVLLGIGEPLRGKLLIYDALDMSMRTLSFSTIEREPVTELIDYEGFCGVKPMSMPFAEISPTQYRARCEQGWNPLFIDTRNDIEASIVTLPDTDSLIPHEDILLANLPKNRDIVLYCRTGGRSAMAAYALAQSGHDPSKLFNLGGGIHSWHSEIDSSIPKY